MNGDECNRGRGKQEWEARIRKIIGRHSRKLEESEFTRFSGGEYPSRLPPLILHSFDFCRLPRSTQVKYALPSLNLILRRIVYKTPS